MISVVIPTLNEAAALPATLQHAREMSACRDTEFIVSDCGSRDGTDELALRAGARLVRGGTSRATALNLGADAARGDAILFLHADSKVPPGFDRLVADALTKPAVVGGAFDFNWSSHPLNRGVNRELLRIVRVTNRIRFRWTGNFYGDQGIFVATPVFDRLGGFPEVTLMEDIRFSRKLKNAGRTAIVASAIKTSPRRFLTRGVLRQFAQDLLLLSLDAAGFMSDRACERYNGLNRSSAYRTVCEGRRRPSVRRASDQTPGNPLQLPRPRRVDTPDGRVARSV